jgi:hypothetical protein
VVCIYGDLGNKGGCGEELDFDASFGDHVVGCGEAGAEQQERKREPAHHDAHIRGLCPAWRGVGRAAGGIDVAFVGGVVLWMTAGGLAASGSSASGGQSLVHSLAALPASTIIFARYDTRHHQVQLLPRTRRWTLQREPYGSIRNDGHVIMRRLHGWMGRNWDRYSAISAILDTTACRHEA